MRVIIKQKRHAGKRGARACTYDAIALDTISEDAWVAILVNATGHSACFQLDGLAEWFLQATQKGAPPTHPTTREKVPPVVYRQVMRKASKHIPGFEKRLRIATPVLRVPSAPCIIIWMRMRHWVT